MRATVTIDDDVAVQIRRLMRERGVGFKAIVNELLRRGLRSTEAPEPYETPTFAMGVRPGIDLDKALSLAAELEDREVARKLELRS